MIEFKVPDMSCGHCVGAITRTVQELDPQARVEVDLVAKRVKIESQRDSRELAEALAEEGYPPQPA